MGNVSLEIVEQLRAYSRQIVRELGFMRVEIGNLSISHPQFHSLQALREYGSLSIIELAAKLRLDKSTASRMASSLEKHGWVTLSQDRTDLRRKVLQITAGGHAKAEEVNSQARVQVSGALNYLDLAQQEKVLEGFKLYQHALSQYSRQAGYRFRKIDPKDDTAIADVILNGLHEHGAARPGFACNDPEFYCLSTYYMKPRSRYFVIEDSKGKVVGGCGYGPLDQGPGNICELQKMYLLPEARGRGLAQTCLNMCISDAKADGYIQMYLETLDSMKSAQALYLFHGFRMLSEPLGNTGHYGCNVWMVKDLI